MRPRVEYAQEIWHPFLKRQSKLIEGVQIRATKLIPEIKYLLYYERLNYLNLPTEIIQTKTAKNWKTNQLDLHKRPSVFLFLRPSA